MGNCTTIAALALLQAMLPGPAPFGLIGVGLVSVGVGLIQRALVEF